MVTHELLIFQVENLTIPATLSLGCSGFLLSAKSSIFEFGFQRPAMAEVGSPWYFCTRPAVCALCTWTNKQQGSCPRLLDVSATLLASTTVSPSIYSESFSLCPSLSNSCGEQPGGNWSFQYKLPQVSDMLCELSDALKFLLKCLQAWKEDPCTSVIEAWL